ncbi:MAG: hypothetical protein KAI79_11150 [Bacteroidales bacterium]|nr:hypothetical protein [Bacteroidales bacterium]
MNRIRYFIQNSFLTIFSILKFVRYGRLKHGNIFQATKMQDIIILGNGPSLKENLENDINILKKIDTFAVNKFCLTPEFHLLKPKYYLLIDPAFYIKNNTSLKFLDLQKNILASFIKVIDWDMTLFIPIRTDMKDSWDNLISHNKHISISYVNSNAATGFKSITFALYKYNLAMPVTQNVLVGAIFLSLNMGYKKIYLLGAEHSWSADLRVNNENKLCIRNKHYYGEEDTLFYKGLEQKETWKMHEVLSAWSKTFKSYFLLQDYAKQVNANIYNLTTDSYIDAFPKVKFEELFKK